MTSPYASGDLFFGEALKSLPTALLESMIAADLTNPGALRLYPRYSPAELGLLPEIVHVDLEDTAQSCTVSSNYWGRCGGRVDELVSRARCGGLWCRVFVWVCVSSCVC